MPHVGHLSPDDDEEEEEEDVVDEDDEDEEAAADDAYAEEVDGPRVDCEAWFTVTDRRSAG